MNNRKQLESLNGVFPGKGKFPRELFISFLISHCVWILPSYKNTNERMYYFDRGAFQNENK